MIIEIKNIMFYYLLFLDALIQYRCSILYWMRLVCTRGLAHWSEVSAQVILGGLVVVIGPWVGK